MVRMEAGAETAAHLLRFLNDCDRFRHPDVTPDDYVHYGLGDKGLFLSLEKKSKQPFTTSSARKPDPIFSSDGDRY